MCDVGGLQCSYPDAQCNCFGGDWNCFASCPAQEPQPGDACMLSPQQVCTYGATSCLCFQQEFFCNG